MQCEFTRIEMDWCHFQDDLIYWYAVCSFHFPIYERFNSLNLLFFVMWRSTWSIICTIDFQWHGNSQNLIFSRSDMFKSGRFCGFVVNDRIKWIVWATLKSSYGKNGTHLWVCGEVEKKRSNWLRHTACMPSSLKHNEWDVLTSSRFIKFFDDWTVYEMWTWQKFYLIYSHSMDYLLYNNRCRSFSRPYGDVYTFCRVLITHGTHVISFLTVIVIEEGRFSSAQLLHAPQKTNKSNTPISNAEYYVLLIWKWNVINCNEWGHLQVSNMCIDRLIESVLGIWILSESHRYWTVFHFHEYLVYINIVALSLSPSLRYVFANLPHLSFVHVLLQNRCMMSLYILKDL